MQLFLTIVFCFVQEEIPPLTEQQIEWAYYLTLRLDTCFKK